MSHSRRRQYMTDEAVQGELLFRAIIYWCFCLMSVSLLVLAWSMYSGPPRPFSIVVQESLIRCSPAILSSVIVLPIVLWDVLKVSNRFVGPVQQVRNGLRKMAEGQRVPPIELRKNDFWQELAFYFNKVAVDNTLSPSAPTEPTSPESTTETTSDSDQQLADTSVLSQTLQEHLS